MALGRDIKAGTTNHGLSNGYGDAGSSSINPAGSVRSNMVAFATGGLLIAGGLVSFLFYDGDQLGRHAPTQQVNALRFEAPAQPVRNIVTAQPKPAPRQVTTH
ncbi:MAG TPA: hypothetical protein VGD16_12655 [Enterovirga sp.]|jgi:hypothetical protein